VRRPPPVAAGAQPAARPPAARDDRDDHDRDDHDREDIDREDIDREDIDREDIDSAQPGEIARPDPRWVLPATYAVLFALGAELGGVGSFLVPLRVGAVVLPLSIVIAVVGNAAVGVFGARGTGSRLGAAVPGLGWLLVVGVLASARPEGDVVLTGGPVGLGFTVGGALAATAVIGWPLRPASPPSPGRR